MSKSKYESISKHPQIQALSKRLRALAKYGMSKPITPEEIAQDEELRDLIPKQPKKENSKR